MSDAELYRLHPAAVVVPGADATILNTELGTIALPGTAVSTLMGRLLPLLREPFRRSAVIKGFADELHATITGLLDLLERHGVVERCDDPGETSARRTSQRRILRLVGTDPSLAAERLTNSRILIVGLAPWALTATRSLALAGVGHVSVLDAGTIQPDQLAVVPDLDDASLKRDWDKELPRLLRATDLGCRLSVVRDNDVEATMGAENWDLVVSGAAGHAIVSHRQVAALAARFNRPALFASIQAFEGIIGPLTIPGRTACWNCARWRTLNASERPHDEAVVQEAMLRDHSSVPSRACLPTMSALAGEIVAHEIVKALTGYAESALLGAIAIYDFTTLRCSVHRIVPMPWCDICGGASGLPASGDSMSLATISTPQELQYALAGWIDGRTGIVTHVDLRPAETRQPQLPICAKAFLSAWVEHGAQPALPEPTGGKGGNVVEALLGAVGEAIERYSAARVPLHRLCRTPAQELGDEVLEPDRLCLYADEQYERAGFPFRRYVRDVPHYWVRGEWLDSGKPLWVPAALAYFSATLESAAALCQVTSSGLAAGADRDDAAVRAICELAERDAFMLTWLARLPARRVAVDFARLGADVVGVVEHLRRCGARIEIYRLDVGVPIHSIACVGIGDGERWPAATVTTAADLSLSAAVRGAVFEQGYSGSYVKKLILAGERPIPTCRDAVHCFMDHALYYAPLERLVAFDFVRCGHTREVSLDSYREPPRRDLVAYRECLTSAGFHVALVDVTSPDVARSPFRVVRALGPEFQPLHCGSALARLANPRLARLTERPNEDPHPLC